MHPNPIKYDLTSEHSFDPTRLTDAFPDNPELVSEILTLCIDSLNRLRGDLLNYPDYNAREQAAHKIKGCAAECGAWNLYEQASQLERACAVHSRHQLTLEFDNFERVFQQTIDEISDWMHLRN